MMGKVLIDGDPISMPSSYLWGMVPQAMSANPSQNGKMDGRSDSMPKELQKARTQKWNTPIGQRWNEVKLLIVQRRRRRKCL
jgi:hypothetical protein